jgi:hypothetical protein
MATSFIPAKLNPPLWKGSTFRYVFQWLDDNGTERKPHDLTGYTGVLQLLGPAQEVLHELTTGNGGIKLPEPTQGFVELYIDAEETTAFTWKKGVYTLFLQEPSEPKDTYSLLTGVFTVSTAGMIQ